MSDKRKIGQAQAHGKQGEKRSGKQHIGFRRVQQVEKHVSQRLFIGKLQLPDLESRRDLGNQH